jgi:hypothetical protein
MHTLQRNKSGKYDVIFWHSSYNMIIIADVDFGTAIWYVNILNGGDGKYDKRIAMENSRHAHAQQSSVKDL